MVMVSARPGMGLKGQHRCTADQQYTYVGGAASCMFGATMIPISLLVCCAAGCGMDLFDL
jgi:hypothetical protein